MFALELDNATATLEHLNTRTEKSGSDDIPAASLKISCAQPADVLAHFSPTLKAHLFDASGPKDLLGDGARVRYPHLDYPLAMDHEMTGASVSIDYGVGKPIELDECTVNRFQITPMEGGTTVIAFQVHCHPDAEKQLPKLYRMQKKGVTFTLAPADLPELTETKDGKPITPLIPAEA